MICPGCHRETSDISNTCVWCGATLDWSRVPSDPYTAQNSSSPDGPSSDQPQAPGSDSFQDSDAVGRSVSEWPSTGADHRAPQPRQKRWYLTPWPYAVAVLIAIGVLSFILLKGDKGSGAFPELVVGDRPTLLDIYTDT
jgi:hypothetical protein